MNLDNVNIGIDITDIDRFSGMIDNPKLLQKIYTPREIHYCQNHKSAAGCFAVRFAGKEAVQKAVDSGIPFNQIEITNKKNGLPIVRILKPDYRERVLKISLSHSNKIAIAVVIARKS
jgi:holo-[acyl-carrier protein] synthase